MTLYKNIGRSVLRPDGHRAIGPGDTFRHDYTPAEERALVEGGAIERLDPPDPVPATPAPRPTLDTVEPPAPTVTPPAPATAPGDVTESASSGPTRRAARRASTTAEKE